MIEPWRPIGRRCDAQGCHSLAGPDAEVLWTGSVLCRRCADAVAVMIDEASRNSALAGPSVALDLGDEEAELRAALDGAARRAPVIASGRVRLRGPGDDDG